MQKTEKQTLGEFFQDARKAKSITIDEIVRDTNIPKRYLESIESDNFDVFPGETYAMGFITNYADALEVDRDAALVLYKRQMKMVQDSPIEQLVGKKRPFTINSNYLTLGSVIAVSILVVILIAVSIRNSDSSTNASPKNYRFAIDDSSSIANVKYKVGDSIALTNLDQVIQINLNNVNQNRSLLFKVNHNEYTLKNGGIISVDSDTNGTNDLGIELFSAKTKEIKLAITVLREIPDSTGTNTMDDVYNKYKEFILSESEFMTSPTKTTIEMRIVSSSTAWINYTADNRDAREVLLNNGSSVPLSFNDHLILFFGNAGAAKIIVGNREETGGGWGETVKSIFYWKTKNNQMVLVRANLK